MDKRSPKPQKPSTTPEPQLIHTSSDEWGPIEIYEDQHRRWLSFGNHTEQSSILKQFPDVLVYPYNQAMMLALVFHPYPQRLCVLGIGGGSLVTTLHQRVPHAKIEAVELRPALIPLAQQFFHMPESERISLHKKDALVFLRESTHRYDLLLSDLYHADGMDQQQISQEFIQQCYNHLNNHGILIINIWEEDEQATEVKLVQLMAIFEQRVIRLTVPGKNNTIFAFRDTLPILTKQQLEEKVMVLDSLFRIPLREFFEDLWHSYDAAVKRLS